MESGNPNAGPAPFDERLALQQFYATHYPNAADFEPGMSMATTIAPFNELQLSPHNTDWNQFQHIPTEIDPSLVPLMESQILPPTDPAVLPRTHPTISIGIGPSNECQMNRQMNDTMTSIREQGQLRTATASWPQVESMISLTDEAILDPWQVGQGILLGRSFIHGQSAPDGYVEVQPELINRAAEELPRQEGKYRDTQADSGADKDKSKIKAKDEKRKQGGEDKRRRLEEHKHKKSSRKTTTVSNRGTLPQAIASASASVGTSAFALTPSAKTRATGSAAASKHCRSSNATMSSMNEASVPAPVAIPATPIPISGASSPPWSAPEPSAFSRSIGTATSATASPPEHECLLASPEIASSLLAKLPLSHQPSGATTTVDINTDSKSATLSPSSKRARNRVAATKCRAKTKAAIAKLEADERMLSSRHELLTEEKAQLRDEIYVLKKMLLEHSGCNCVLIREYLANTARLVAEAPGDEAGFGPGFGLIEAP